MIEFATATATDDRPLDHDVVVKLWWQNAPETLDKRKPSFSCWIGIVGRKLLQFRMDRTQRGDEEP